MYESKMLDRMGMTTQVEQYGLYASLVIPVIGSFLPLRKAYYINKYVNEIDAEMKIMIAGKANLSESEKLASTAFLKNYKAVPRRLLLAFLLLLFCLSLLSRATANSKNGGQLVNLSSVNVLLQ
jgi:hypothetical protein